MIQEMLSDLEDVISKSEKRLAGLKVKLDKATSLTYPVIVGWVSDEQRNLDMLHEQRELLCSMIRKNAS